MFRSLACLFSLILAAPAWADPLPSWADGDARDRIIAFVETVTDPGSEEYVTPADRIAVFDNDGTLWSEKPVYFQVLFAMDVVRAMAEADPSILTSDALRAAAAGDLEAVAASGEAGLIEIVKLSHSGMTVSEFMAAGTEWLETARHPDTGRAYDEMVFQPMLELLRYLRDEGFDTYIVSGGGLHLLRTFAEETYGIPPEQVIGSTGKTTYQVIDGVPSLMKDPAIAFIDDKEGKPVAIDQGIGRRPILAGGNSDGDFQMLEWTTAGDGPRLALIVHHTDDAREYAYDREGHVGVLNRGLDEAEARGWLLVDMKEDWLTVYPR